MPPRRNGKHWEQLLQKTDLEFLLSGKKGDRPVEARLVDFVWRSRQSLGRGLAIFHRSRFDAAPPAAFPAKSAAATLLILFLSLLHYQGEGGLFWHIWVLSLKNCNSWMFFLQHQSLVGGPNPSCCPICNKLCMTGELLMEHMKFVHKDPNASGVPGEFCNHYMQPAWCAPVL